MRLRTIDAKFRTWLRCHRAGGWWSKETVSGTGKEGKAGAENARKVLDEMQHPVHFCPDKFLIYLERSQKDLKEELVELNRYIYQFANDLAESERMDIDNSIKDKYCGENLFLHSTETTLEQSKS